MCRLAPSALSSAPCCTCCHGYTVCSSDVESNASRRLAIRFPPTPDRSIHVIVALGGGSTYVFSDKKMIVQYHAFQGVVQTVVGVMQILRYIHHFTLDISDARSRKLSAAWLGFVGSLGRNQPIRSCLCRTESGVWVLRRRSFLYLLW